MQSTSTPCPSQPQPFWQATSTLFQSLIPKPKMSQKLLMKPPFKYILDIIKQTIKATGFATQLFTAEELEGEFPKQAKLAFLDKFIKFLEGSKAVVIEAKPLKIVAGLEPEKTNAMLRGFGQMAWNHLQAGGKKEEKKEENGGSGGGNGGGSFSYWSMFGNNSAAMSQNTVEHVNSPVLNVPYIPPIAFQSPSPQPPKTPLPQSLLPQPPKQPPKQPPQLPLLLPKLQKISHLLPQYPMQFLQSPNLVQQFYSWLKKYRNQLTDLIEGERSQESIEDNTRRLLRELEKVEVQEERWRRKVRELRMAVIDNHKRIRLLIGPNKMIMN